MKSSFRQNAGSMLLLIVIVTLMSCSHDCEGADKVYHKEKKIHMPEKIEIDFFGNSNSVEIEDDASIARFMEWLSKVESNRELSGDVNVFNSLPIFIIRKWVGKTGDGFDNHEIIVYRHGILMGDGRKIVVKMDMQNEINNFLESIVPAQQLTEPKSAPKTAPANDLKPPTGEDPKPKN